MGYGFTFLWNPSVHSEEGILASIERRGYRRSDVKIVGLPIMYQPDYLAEITGGEPQTVGVFVAESYFDGRLIFERPRDYWCHFSVATPEAARRFYMDESMERIRDNRRFYRDLERKGENCREMLAATERELARLKWFIRNALYDTDAYANLLLAAMDAVGWQAASAACFLESDVASY